MTEYAGIIPIVIVGLSAAAAMEIDKQPGLRRVAWNLRSDPAPNANQGQGRGFGGRGGPPQGPLVAPGRYRAVLGKLVGDTVTPIGSPQSFTVVQIAQ